MGAGARWVGIDFSGSSASWSPGTRTSNVWISILDEPSNGRFDLVEIARIRDFSGLGAGAPFPALAHYLKQADFSCAAIDAPFSLPAAAMPPGGYRTLLDLIKALPVAAGRWFPQGYQLLEIARHRLGDLGAHGSKQFPRAAEHAFSATRTPLWNGPRGGAAFTVACLRLLADAGYRQPWPGSGKPPRLVEAYPAAQLAHWHLPNKKYDGNKADAPRIRQQIATQIFSMWAITTSAAHRAHISSSADALDSLICAFGARAAYRNIAIRAPTQPATLEGWISVHPTPRGRD